MRLHVFPARVGMKRSPYRGFRGELGTFISTLDPFFLSPLTKPGQVVKTKLFLRDKMIGVKKFVENPFPFLQLSKS